MLARTIAKTLSNLRDAIERRRWGRIRLGYLSCNLGRVLDLSAGGARIVTRRRLSKSAKLILGDPQSRVILTAMVTWRKRRGWRLYEVGLEFGEVSPRDRALMAKLMLGATFDHIPLGGDSGR